MADLASFDNVVKNKFRVSSFNNRGDLKFLLALSGLVIRMIVMFEQAKDCLGFNSSM